MVNFPFFRFPYTNLYYPYYNNYIGNRNLSKNATTTYMQNKSNMNYLKSEENIKKKDRENKKIDQESNNFKKKRPPKYNSFGPIYFNNSFMDGNLEDPVLEILGIKLYLDDLIILGLLFLLYNEDVQDETLFLTLAILLLT